MGLAVLSILTILVLVIQGYRYNRYDGKVEQGGLVQFNSRPTGATVTVDDATLANKTASKVTLTAGAHTVTMTKDGYTSWKKDVVVKAGGILWLNYARLLPTSLAVSQAASFSGVASALPAPNQKTMVVLPVDTEPEITLVTLNDTTPKSTKLTIPATAYTAPDEGQAQAFSLLQWDKDNNLLLVRHTYGDKTEYISFDTRDATAHNITKELGIEIADIDYSLQDSNVLYVLTTAHELRRVTLGSATVSGPLATNVDSVAVDESRVIAYTTLADADGVRTVGYVTQGNNTAKTLFSYDSLGTAGLQVATGNYYGQHYVAVLRGETLVILRGDLPASDSTADVSLKKIAQLTIADGGDHLGFSPASNRMVYVGRGSKVVTYDLELLVNATVTLQSPLTRDVQWLDEFHIMATGGTAHFYDYDGTNGQQFAASALDQPAVMSNNEKYLYYFATVDDGVALQRVKLTTD